MTSECRPPEGTKSESWHVIRDDDGVLGVAYWFFWNGAVLWFRIEKDAITPEMAAEIGWRYVCPLDLADVVARYGDSLTEFPK